MVLVTTGQSVLTVHRSCRVRVAARHSGPSTSLTEWNALRLAFSLACGTAIESKPTMRQTPPAHRAKILPPPTHTHKNSPQIRFNRPSAKYSPNPPPPCPPPLHSLRQSHPPRRADTSAPRFGDPLAPTIHSRILSSSSRAATSGYVLVEVHGGQRRHRWRCSCGDARRSASPTVRAF